MQFFVRIWACQARSKLVGAVHARLRDPKVARNILDDVDTFEQRVTQDADLVTQNASFMITICLNMSSYPNHDIADSSVRYWSKSLLSRF